MLTDEKSDQNYFVRSIFNPTHHFVDLCDTILAVVRMAFVRKFCGGKFGWSALSIPRQNSSSAP